MVTESKVYNSELKKQYEVIYAGYSTEIPSCYVEGVKHSMFQVASLNGMNFKDVGWGMKFKCPFTGKGMKIANQLFTGPLMWVPTKVALNSPEVINNIKK
jgi:hypothetical protein